MGNDAAVKGITVAPGDDKTGLMPGKPIGQMVSQSGHEESIAGRPADSLYLALHNLNLTPERQHLGLEPRLIAVARSSE